MPTLLHLNGPSGIEERGGDELVLEGRRQLLDLASEQGCPVVDTTDRAAALRAGHPGDGVT